MQTVPYGVDSASARGGEVATKAQIEANGKNAERSTGPRTQEGKARSRQNAMKHGIFASDVLLRLGEAREDAEALEALHEGLREQFGPIGEMEEQLVSSLAANLWRERRLLR